MKSERPPSSSSFLINVLGGLCYLLSIPLCLYFDPKAGILTLCLIGLAAGTLPIVLCELFFLKVHKREASGVNDKPIPDRARASVKLIGYYASIALLMILYSIVPEYTYDEFYHTGFLMLLILAVVFIIGGWLYIPWFDSLMRDPYDAYWHLGSFLLLRKGADRKKILDHLKSLLLRAYFLPVMTVYFFYNTTKMIEGQEEFILEFISKVEEAPGIAIVKFILIIYLFLASMDVLFANIGYLMTFRFLDTHIRSTDPTFFGWFICIVCYFPFFELLLIKMFFYDLYNGNKWNDWLVDMPYLVVVWGVFVLLAQCLESLTTLTFGLRFSNLTYRGLITAGPFRFTKHPQYVSKIFNRFFFLMPFLSMNGLIGAVENMLMFAGVCFIYFMRARTEENHLSRYPEYVRYALWIDENGIFRAIGRWLPFVQYDAARAQKGKLL